MSATADTALTKTIATVVTENKVHPVSKHFTRKEASLKVRLGEVEKLVQVPGKGFIERPSCCPDDGYLYFIEIEAGWISRTSMDRKYEPFHNIGAPGDLMGPNGMIYDSKEMHTAAWRSFS
jgi:hypothetical protein